MTAQRDDPWLRFRIADADSAGVDTRTLASLLDDLADAMLAAARQRLGQPARRSGRMSALEHRLAAIRVVSVTPGSLSVEFREPPSVGAYQTTFDSELGIELTADIIARDLIAEVESTKAGGAPAIGTEQRRDAVERLLLRAGTIGDFAEITHKSLTGERSEVSVELAAARPRVIRDSTSRNVTLFGHAYMVDVEMGRQRLRVKLPSGADLTMDLDAELRSIAMQALDQPVQVTVDETLSGGTVTHRLVQDVRVLDLDEQGPESPPKALLDLAREQGLLFGPAPDYVALATEVWQTSADIQEAEGYLVETRSTGQ